jgi:phasin family protein
MFGQFSEQMKKSSQPANELFAANVKAIETVTKLQTQFFSGLVEDSVKLMKTVAQQTEVQGVIAAQSVYAESVRERLTSNSKVTYNTVSAVSKQYTDALQSGISTATEAVKEKVTATAAPAKKATPVKKATPAKKAPAKAVVTSAKTPKAAVKTTSDAGKVTAEKQTAKAATNTKATSETVAQQPATKATPAPKSAAKPVATLSAEEVKAPAKIKTTDVKTIPEKQSEVETKA